MSGIPRLTSPAEVYTAYNEAENRHDLEASTALVAPDLVVTVNGRPVVSSAEDDRIAMAQLLARYPDYRRELDEVLAVRDRVIVRWRMIGTPVEASVPRLEVAGCSIVRAEGGRLVEAYLYYDGKPLDDALHEAALS